MRRSVCTPPAAPRPFARCKDGQGHVLTVTRAGLQPLLPLAEGHALAVFTLAEIQAHRVVGSIAGRGALTAVTCSTQRPHGPP